MKDIRNTNSYSKFTDKTDKSFENIIKILDSRIGESTEEVNNEELKTSFKGYTELGEIVISGNKYTYKVYKYLNESINKGFETDSNRETRVSSTEALLIVLTNGSINQFVISKSNSNSQGKAIIRKLMGYEDKGEIENNQISLLSDKDFYLWLFYVVLNDVNENDKLSVQSIEAYSGNTYIDKLTNVSGTGSKVMNLLSTLTFLFEIKEINKVKVKIKFEEYNKEENVFEEHIFETEFFDNGTSNNLKIDINHYKGVFDELEETGDFIACVVMKVMFEVLPLLSSIYTNAEWDKVEFNRSIGKEVINRINSELIDNENQEINLKEE
ncbi:hypothetical protein ACPAY5_07355 [Staphylococcus caledonicus]|uniref:hypothetical protein n=1 Tax=Staphylococcus caledonicus TaxID=2741333 RepID=UPI003C30BD64